MAVHQLLGESAARVEASLGHWLPAAETPPRRLHAAMRYASLNGGKRIRPALTYATGQVLGLPTEQLDGPACAVELIHAYSLVHDDLPAMDDDELRRGKPTCHVAYDEATAILVGDALQSLAFEILGTDPAMVAEPALRLEMVAELARASGSLGMAGGQAMDMEATGRSLQLNELETMHGLKTGALIRASVRLAALSRPGLPQPQRKGLDQYARAIGLAFQIQDDILDVEGSTATLGKPQGSDAGQAKATYTALLGLEGAKAKARETHHQALAGLEAVAGDTAPLRAIADFIIERVS